VEEKDEKGFTIRDRRTASAEHAPEAQAKTAKEQMDSSGKRSSDATQPTEEKGRMPLPELDFSSFILSLATTAQISLGTVPNPQTGKPEQNLTAAKQMIDIIGILKEKTKGNLSAEEQGLLDNMLFSLRMQYVSAVESKK
jgi:hypothetical protein